LDRLAGWTVYLGQSLLLLGQERESPFIITLIGSEKEAWLNAVLYCPTEEINDNWFLHNVLGYYTEIQTAFSYSIPSRIVRVSAIIAQIPSNKHYTYHNQEFVGNGLAGMFAMCALFIIILCIKHLYIHNIISTHHIITYLTTGI
jgi:hypothetical protein